LSPANIISDHSSHASSILVQGVKAIDLYRMIKSEASSLIESGIDSAVH